MPNQEFGRLRRYASIVREQLRRDLAAAIKARDRITMSALRSALSALDNAEATEGDLSKAGQSASEHIAGAAVGIGTTEVPRRTLTDAHVEAILRREVAERLHAAGETELSGRPDGADRLRAEARVLSRYIASTETLPDG